MKKVNKRITVTEEQELFGVYVNTDLTEGRGHQYLYALAEKEITAQRLAKGRDVQGCDGEVRKITAHFVPKDKKYPSLGEWIGPIGLVYSPNDQDIRDEKAFLAEKAKDLLLEKFKKGENLTKEEKAELLTWIK